jgi:YNFM family putative membrane transporter
MNRQSFFPLQALVFGLVAAALTTVYITQPVLPVIELEFGVTPSQASYTVSAVILGIALANLPFGLLADRFPVQRLILVGGVVVMACGLFCAGTSSLTILVAARFIQGLFVPALTTCLAAYLSTNLPLERLNVAMGSYVSATVAGGLGGRLLGGWIHPPLHWRYAFVTASLLVGLATLTAVLWLPAGQLPRKDKIQEDGFWALFKQAKLRRSFLVAFGGFFVFSSIFNYLPFYLHRPPFNASTEFITLLYLAYLIGIFTGPMAGQLSNRIGNGGTMVLGSLVFALAISLTLIKSIFAIIVALMMVCGGFFSIHASAAGSLNRKLTSSRGRANSLYVLAYYLGGAVGITLSGYAYGLAGWPGVAALGLVMLAVPLLTGLKEMQERTAGTKQKLNVVP